MIGVIFFLLSTIEIRSTSAIMKTSMLRTVHHPVRPPQKDYDFDVFCILVKSLQNLDHMETLKFGWLGRGYRKIRRKFDLWKRKYNGVTC